MDSCPRLLLELLGCTESLLALKSSMVTAAWPKGNLGSRVADSSEAFRQACRAQQQVACSGHIDRRTIGQIGVVLTQELHKANDSLQQ